MSGHDRRSGDSDPGFQMAPMIDVVFLLLIFFMCSSSLRPPERTVELEQAVLGARAAETLPVQIEVEIDRAARVRFNGLELGFGAAGAMELERRLRELAGKFGEDQAVLIRADRLVPYQQVMDLLAACARAGVDSVAILAGTGGP